MTLWGICCYTLHYFYRSVGIKLTPAVAKAPSDINLTSAHITHTADAAVDGRGTDLNHTALFGYLFIRSVARNVTGHG